MNALPMLFNGPRETLVSGAQYSRMDPALRLRGTADLIA
jgi:hypothetical protein